MHRAKAHRYARTCNKSPSQFNTVQAKAHAHTWTCQICNRAFLNKDDLRKHQKLRMCLLCNQSMIECKLTRHLDEKHNKEISELPSEGFLEHLITFCQGCNRGFLSRNGLHKHQKLRVCLLCQQSMMQCELQRHVKDHHKKEISKEPFEQTPKVPSDQIPKVPSDKTPELYSDPTTDHQENNSESLKEDSLVSSTDDQDDKNSEVLYVEIEVKQEEENIFRMPCEQTSNREDQQNSSEIVTEEKLSSCDNQEDSKIQEGPENDPEILKHLEERHNKATCEVFSSQNESGEGVVKDKSNLEPHESQIKCEENVNVKQNFLDMEQDMVTMEQDTVTMDTQALDNNIWIEPDPSTVTVITPLEEDSVSEMQDAMQIIAQGILGNSTKSMGNGSIEEEQNISMDPNPGTLKITSHMEEDNESVTERIVQIIPHVKSYWQTSKCKCAECGHYFPSTEALERHVAQVHKSNQNTHLKNCFENQTHVEKCSEDRIVLPFPKDGNLSIDEMMQRICTKCGQYYTSAEELKNQCYWRTEIKCAKCDHYFPCLGALKKHVNQRHKSENQSGVTSHVENCSESPILCKSGC